LKDKELFTTTKPQKPVKLTVDNTQLRYWNEHEACESFQYLHILVENICQRYHRIYLEDIDSQLDPRSYKRSL
jgi:hypothetical protein